MQLDGRIRHVCYTTVDGGRVACSSSDDEEVGSQSGKKPAKRFKSSEHDVTKRFESTGSRVNSGELDVNKRFE